MRRPALILAPVAALSLAVALAGCGSSGDDASTTTTSPSTTATTTAPASSTTTSTAVPGTTSTTTSGPPTCTTAELTGELGPLDAGAGQVYAPLVLRNTGRASCEVRGFPGVSVLDASGTQLGEPATREGTEGGPVVLAPGDAASSVLHTTNEGIGGSCLAPSARMRVFPPGQTEALTFDATYTVCGGFTVTSLVAGDTGLA